MLRAVVDTNVWVSALLNPAGYPARVLESFPKRAFRSSSQSASGERAHRSIVRPRLVRKYKLAPDDVARFIALLLERSESVSTQGNIQMCRDPRDDIVLETALTGGASFLVSRDDDIKRDEDLVNSMKLEGVRVLSVADFLARLPEKT